MDTKQWFVVDRPWGFGNLIVEGDPDPHKGRFIADCESIAFAGDEDGYYGADGDPAANAGRIVAEHNATLAGGWPEVTCRLEFQLDKARQDYRELRQAWETTARRLLAMGHHETISQAAIASILRDMREFDRPAEIEVAE